jgi:WD40 repeat protein
VAFSPDGNRIASADAGGALKVWEAGRGGPGTFAFRGHTGDVTAADFLPGRRHLVTGSDDRTLRVWDHHTGREVRTMQGHPGGVSAVAVSRDGTRIVSGNSTGMVKLWDAASGRDLGTFADQAEAIIKLVAFSPDGSRIASSSNTGSIRVWDAATGQALHAVHLDEDWKAVVGFSPDCSRVAIGGYEDGRLRVHDLASGKGEWSVAAHGAGVWQVAYSPDGSRVISSGRDYYLRVWDARTGKAVQGIKTLGVVDPLRCLPDGRGILTHAGGMAKTWDTDSGRELFAMPLTYPSAMADARAQTCFAADGSRLVQVGRNTICVRSILADLAERRAARLR